jgi:hypothetical protein
MTVENVPGYVIGFVGTVIATLASTVAYMFKLGKADAEGQLKLLQELHRNRDKELLTSLQEVKEELKACRSDIDDCRKDREDLRVDMAKMSTRLEVYIGNHGGDGGGPIYTPYNPDSPQT